MKIDNRDREIVAAWLPGAEITTPEGNFGTLGPLFKIDVTKFMTSK